ncbi:hypothetical protein WJX73_002364 [Symbiochloris irregularis]|uniref:Uncharacterized protein n=1 Tax=Symbiochloris irregularis TaxID=706552 RepID=A0AAW1P464_9CHLO
MRIPAPQTGKMHLEYGLPTRPSGQNGAPGLAATVEAAASRTNSAASLQPFIVAYAYTYANGSPSLKGYLKTAIDGIISGDGCLPVRRLLVGAYTTAQADSTVASYTQGVSDTFNPDASVAQCFSDFGPLSSTAVVASTLQAAATASS